MRSCLADHARLLLFFFKTFTLVFAIHEQMDTHFPFLTFKSKAILSQVLRNLCFPFGDKLRYFLEASTASWPRKTSWELDGMWGFPCGSGITIHQLITNPPTVQETWVRSLGWGDPLGKGKGNPLQYSGLENSMDCTAHGVTKSRTQLSDFHLKTRWKCALPCRARGSETAARVCCYQCKEPHRREMRACLYLSD